MKIIILIILILSSSEWLYSQVNLTLKIHQPPELVIDAGKDTTLNSGDNYYIGGGPTATGGLGYYDYYWTPSTFLDNPFGANPNILNFSHSMTYILRVEDENCYKQDTISVGLSEITAINGINNELDIKVFPIPVNDNLNIDFGSLNYNNYSIKIIDKNGKFLHYSKADKKLIVLNIAEYSNGFYILKLKNKEIEKSITFIKN